LNAADGQFQWKYPTEGGIVSRPVVYDGNIFFCSEDQRLHVISARTGKVVWTYLGKSSISTPCIADDLIICGAADGFIYAVEAKNAKESWRFRTDHQVNGSPVVYKDSVYCGSVDGSLYCLEYRTGRLRWKFGTEGAITGTPLVYDDVVYIGSTDHHVYALLA
jgi:eukaryotic-like serine/threonine-protein kinase